MLAQSISSTIGRCMVVCVCVRENSDIILAMTHQPINYTSAEKDILIVVLTCFLV